MCDTGDVAALANAFLTFPSTNDKDFTLPKSFLPGMSFGTCGASLGVGMGAKIAAPDRPVVVLIGDCSVGMCLNELLTCVREDIAVIVVVLVNGLWGAMSAFTTRPSLKVRQHTINFIHLIHSVPMPMSS